MKLGGKTCQILWQYGFASLVPILINLSFIAIVYLEDLKLGNATKMEAIFVLLLLYPQMKCLKFLLQFFFHRDEKKLNGDKDEYDDRLGSHEPFLESALQASSGCSFENYNDCNYFSYGLLRPSDLKASPTISDNTKQLQTRTSYRFHMDK